MRRKSICFYWILSLIPTVIHLGHHMTQNKLIMTEEYHHKHMHNVRVHTGSAVMMSVTMMMLTLVCMSDSGFFCFVNCRNCEGKVQTVFGSVAHSAHGGAPPEDREALNQPEQQVQTGTASSCAWQIHIHTHTQ